MGRHNKEVKVALRFPGDKWEMKFAQGKLDGMGDLGYPENKDCETRKEGINRWGGKKKALNPTPKHRGVLCVTLLD